MSNVWLWWATLVLLTLGTALLGLRWGWIATTVTESDVINRYATRYVQSHGEGARMSDCVGVPGTDLPGVWLLVSCRPRVNTGVGSYDFYVNRLGGFEYGERPTTSRVLTWEPQT